MTSESRQDARLDQQNGQLDRYFYPSKRGQGHGLTRSGGLSIRPKSPGRPDYIPIDRELSWSEMCERHKTLLANLKDYLPNRQIKEDVYEAVYANDITRLPHLIDHDTTKEIDRTRHYDVFDQLLKVETVHQDVEMRKYDLKNKKVDLRRCSIDYPGLSNGQPSLVPGDYAILYDDNFVEKFIMPIKTTIGDFIILHEGRCKKYEKELTRPYNIAFYSSGIQFELCRLALVKSYDCPGIAEIIWEDLEGEPDSEEQKVINLDLDETDFLDIFSGRTGDSCIEKLFKTEGAYRSTKKVYIINPELAPKKCNYPNYTGDTFSFNYRLSDRSDYPSKDDRVIIQNPETLETIVLPCQDRFTVKIMEDGRSQILELLCEPNLDFMFVASSLVEKSGLRDGIMPQNQPSLRDIFHEGREEIDSMDESHKIDVRRTNTPELLLRLGELNDPQKEAILAILEARLRPKPYILFGPPGTGKTHTLVEAVVQIYKRHPKAKILFVANSNTCADQIFEKLQMTGVFDVNDYERVRAGDSVAGKGFRRIIVTTNMKSGSFITQFTKFDYVIIDEAGHAHEPETLVPISTLETSDGVLILAGDPQQLGPVIMNHQAGDLGLGKSMLERIFKFKAYDKNHPYGRYNKFCISKLLYSYRCDPSILEISNRLFYGNELKCVNRTPASLLKIMNLKKSVQFHHVPGRENRPLWSNSWRNYNEVSRCIDILLRLYSIGLESSQIGVITPYKLQAKEITKALKKALDFHSNFINERFPGHVELSPSANNALSTDDLINGLSRLALKSKSVKAKPQNDLICKIDTVDAFQGNEREVIIISTVRTDLTRRLDFLNDARRFNVAVSRAKWLVIALGQQDILQRGEFWPEYIKAAETNALSMWPRESTYKDPFKTEKSLFKV